MCFLNCAVGLYDTNNFLEMPVPYESHLFNFLLMPHEMRDRTETKRMASRK